VIAQHHERWEGGGYPWGMVGSEISLCARIFALCDVYDALTSERPYKVAWSREEALAEIQAQSGKHFDPELVPHFIEMARSLDH
jgi:HD-GYP domain-containing protein (c-di-GMP phosphodiesterase class II)